MLDVLIWWALLELIGLAVWPVAFHFFRNLPDRGYAFVKPLGLLLIAYPFWLLTTFGFLDNTQGAIALVAIIVGVLSWWLGGRGQTAEGSPRVAGRDQSAMSDARQWADEGQPVREDFSGVKVTPAMVSPLDWLRQHLHLVLTVELVFTVAFIGWAFVRAFMPEINGTEKPMEFAFLNGILQSNHFPPQDPWLAGYAISYYFFGYVMMAMLTLLSGVASSVTFNLGIALLFALSATGAFGLAYNLIQPHLSGWRISARSVVFSLAAPVLLLIAGNLEGLFESLHSRGLGSAAFWNWLDVNGLAAAPVTGSFIPTDFWWWWRASRVIHDVVNGKSQEVIDEFPQFSFLLGDMHPHVLALPFVLLTLAASLNILCSDSVRLLFKPQEQLPSESERGGLSLSLLSWGVPGKSFLLQFALLPLIIGSLPFLNFWDILPYGFVVIAAYAVARYRMANRWDEAATHDFIVFVVALGVLSLFLYLPFFLGFQSQAGGILPVLSVKTRLHQFLLMFGLFVFIAVVYLIRLLYEDRGISIRGLTTRASPFLIAIFIFPMAVAALVSLVLAVSPALQASASAAFPNSSGNLLVSVLSAFFGPLFADPWLFILLALVLTAILLLLRLRIVDLGSADPSTLFVLLLFLTGFLLTLGVEFLYLKDVFGTRMNTVFKFYFQAWTLFSISGAFAVFYLFKKLGGLARGAWFLGVAALLVASLVYPALAIPNRADNFDKQPTLDGTLWIKSTNPGDYATIEWLLANAPRGSRILESTGRDYTYDDRISMATGLPTVLGWIGHENQWRGSDKLYKDDAKGIDRAADVARIYQTTDSKEALTLLDKYAISFVIVGQTEKSQYGLAAPQIDKFGQILKLVFENGGTRIYARAG